jgi:hypothetical protein
MQVGHHVKVVWAQEFDGFQMDDLPPELAHEYEQSFHMQQQQQRQQWIDDYQRQHPNMAGGLYNEGEWDGPRRQQPLLSQNYLSYHRRLLPRSAQDLGEATAAAQPTAWAQQYL